MSTKQIILTIVGIVFIGIFPGLWLLSNALACGKLLSSADVQEARKKNVLITEYVCINSGDKISSCKLTPIEAWSEHYWEYKDVWRNIKIHKKHQFLVRFSPNIKKEMLNDCFEKYEVVGINAFGIGYCGHHKLCFSIKDAVFPDSFTIIIEDGTRFLFKKRN